MKLKHTTHLAAIGLSVASMLFSVSCKDDDITSALSSEAKIENYAFIVSGASVDGVSRDFRGTFSADGDTIYIRVPENADLKTELNGATPKFFISMGASVTPPMSEPQDFTDPDNPVVYTVTSADGSNSHKFYVTYMIIPPTCVDPGKGFTACEMNAYKTYVELGYPGTYATWSQSDVINVTMGDLMGSPAFCGKDHVVVFSPRYAWGDDGSTTAANAMAADHRYAFKVYNVATLDEDGELNLGGISPSDIVAISSDWEGNMIAAVGRKATAKTDFYYWTSPEAEPIHIGTAPVSVEIGNHNADAGTYINVAGVVTEDCVIASAAPRDNDGSHYKFKVAAAKLVPGYNVIKTGHSSNDKSWFQMISFFGPEDDAPYLVGDCEVNGTELNGQVRVYLNNPNGTNRGTMDYHLGCVNGWMHDDGEQWWSRSGNWLSRGGGRRPTVHAMVLNGKNYSYFTTGSDWRARGVLLEQELDAGVEIKDENDNVVEVNPYPHFGFGNITKAKNPNKDEGGIYLGQSFGMMADWYFDDETQQGYIAVWADRFGLIMFKVTCQTL